ncbi:hypothetical protein [Paraburkholderia sp. J67]|uniref:hypothetical protein n=1 Tax=Paraburkholderia sp. J67 TaxID=2805435 RepID=UPI002ABE6B31|nr:hypothetical protein [Paraburkholderia sp. J67]
MNRSLDSGFSRETPLGATTSAKALAGLKRVFGRQKEPPSHFFLGHQVLVITRRVGTRAGP